MSLSSDPSKSSNHKGVCSVLAYKEPWVRFPELQKTAMATNTCNPGTEEVGIRRLGVQGKPGMHETVSGLTHTNTAPTMQLSDLDCCSDHSPDFAFPG